MPPAEMLTHAEARLALQVARDGSLAEKDRLALEAHLAACAKCRAYAAGLDALETRLGASLQRRWPEQHLDPAQIASITNHIHNQNRRQSMQTRLSKPVFALAWAAVAILLVLFLNWSIGNLVPSAGPGQPGTPSASPTSALTSLPATGQPTASPLPGFPQPPTPGGVRLFPEAQFTFAVPFPEAPQQVVLYKQQLPEALNPEAAQRIAGQLGVNGKIYQGSNEASHAPMRTAQLPIYEINDGRSNVRFVNFAGLFVFEPQEASSIYDNGELPAFDEQVRIAEAYLKERGLLSGEYKATPIPGERGGVRFLNLLDGHPVISGIGENSGAIQWLDVRFSGGGQVRQVSASLHGFEPVGQFPILSAEQAWERLSQENASQRSEYVVLAPFEASTLQTWGRSFSPGQKVILYGYPVTLQPVDPSEAPLVKMRNIPLQNAGALGTGFLQVQGEIVKTSSGGLALYVESWAPSPYPEENLTGKLHFQDGQGQLVSDDGRTLSLVETPASLPEGTKIFASGVIIPGTNQLEWMLLQSGQSPSSYSSMLTCFGGGGGGGGGPENANFGGGGLALVNLNPEQTPTPIPAPGFHPYPVGQVIDRLNGRAWVVINRYPGGQEEMKISLFISSAEGQASFTPYLEGPALAGIEAFHNLPVNIWGKVVRYQDDQPVIAVDRYEEAYPGLSVQAWLGTEQALALEGKEVLLFTSQEGQQFILKSSLDFGSSVAIGPGGGLVIREGLLIPGETFGGYPLMTDLIASIGDGSTDLSTYQITSSQPQVEDLTSSSDSDNQVAGPVTIEEIELAYSAISLENCNSQDAASPELAPWLVAQPVWVFRGHFTDGRRFEMQVQALGDEYLSGP